MAAGWSRRIAVVLGVLVAAAVSQAGGASGLAAAPASTLIAAPQRGALVASTSVQVVVHRRAGATTRVLLGRRDVTPRLRVKGSTLAGTLGRTDGLRYGQNHLVVVAKRAGRAEERHARSFSYLRRSDSLLRVRLSGANPARLQIDVVSGAPRLTLTRRPRTIRVLVNGRPLGRALVAVTGTRWTTSLSATHGLRHGLNRLQVFVAEPQSGRYASLSRRFRVLRDRPLAAAGLDHGTRPDVGVRLGGSHRAARGGRLRYRWTLVRRPAGSGARIQGSTRARPLLVPDRPGRYVARVRVSEAGPARVSAAQVTATSSDETSVNVSPAASLMSLSVNAGPDGERGIRIGEPGGSARFHKHPGPAGTIQWLSLDRRTLEPTANTYCCADPGAVARLTELEQSSAADQLVIVALPPTRGALPQGQYDDFNKLLGAIGVDPLSDRELAEESEQLVAVGVPSGGKGSGWVIRRHTRTGTVDLPRLGWLMPDGDLSAGYRFQPLRIAFDTSSQSTPTSNTMTFGSRPPVTSPPVDVATGAFHVVEVDPADLSVVRNLSFANDVAGRASLSKAIQAASELDGIGNFTGRGNYVALQSIGRFAPENPGWDTEAREANVAESLAAIGASPHHFNYRSARYAFFGGVQLGARGAAQSNTGVVADPVGPVYQRGTLSGDARMNPDGFFVLPAGAATDGPADSLYDVVFDTKAEPFPYTTGPEAGAYDKALAYISGKLGDPAVYDYWQDFSPRGGADFTGDIRGAYLGMPDYDRWDDALKALDTIQYPGLPTGPPCTTPSDVGGNGPGFTPTQFSCLKAQLKQEFVALVVSKGFTDDLERAVALAAGQDKEVLQTTYDTIKEAVDKPDGEIAAPILGLIRTLAEFADLAEIAFAPEVAVAASFAEDVIELTSAVSTESDKPIGQTLAEDVDGLGAKLEGDIARSAASLESVRATAMSDWGRLRALADAGRAAASKSKTEVTNQLASASGRYFTSALIEDLESEGRYRSFRVYTDGTGTGGGPDPVNCRYKYRGAPASSWVPFLYELDRWSSLAYAWPGGTYSDFAPDDIMDQMFESPRREARIAGLGKGYGIEKTSWFWQQADAATSFFRQFDNCTFGS